LDELPPQDNASLLNLLAIVIASDSKAIEIAKNLLQQPVYQNQKQALLLSTLETILVYKLPHLSREEIWKMINLSHIDITRTLFYQDAIQEGRQEGRQEGEKVLLLRVLTKRFGQLKTLVSRKIEQLSLHELEQLADDFLSFSNSEDLERWLADK
jgi:predicted transposase YdaD